MSCRHLLTSVCFTLGPSRSFRAPPTQMCLAGNSRGPLLQTHTTNGTTLLGFFVAQPMLKEEPSNCLAGTEAFGAGAKAAEDPPESAGITQKTSESLLWDANAPTDCVLLLLAADPPPGGTAADVFLISHAGCGAVPGRRRSCCSRGRDPSCSADLRQTHHQHRDDCGGGLKPACSTLRSHREVVRRGGGV